MQSRFESSPIGPYEGESRAADVELEPPIDVTGADAAGVDAAVFDEEALDVGRFEAALGDPTSEGTFGDVLEFDEDSEAVVDAATGLVVVVVVVDLELVELLIVVPAEVREE